jgi:hypothetical protein
MELRVHYHPRRPELATIEVGPTIGSAFVVPAHVIAGVGQVIASLLRALMRA